MMRPCDCKLFVLGDDDGQTCDTEVECDGCVFFEPLEESNDAED